MKSADSYATLEALVRKLKQQLRALDSESHQDSFLHGMIDLPGLILTTQAMLKDAEKRLAGCRQDSPPPPSAPFLVPFTNAGCPSDLVQNYHYPASPTLSRQVTAFMALGVCALTLGSYALREHRLTKNLAAQNQQVAASLDAARSQIESLTVTLHRQPSQPELPSTPVRDIPTVPRSPAPRHRTAHAPLKKIRSQSDGQGKATEDTHGDQAARHDLTSTRTELTGTVAATHHELVLPQKEKSEQNQYEFDVDKSKAFQQRGPLGIRLKKANVKHQYADLELLLDGHGLSQKHVNLYQPVTFYKPGTSQPLELVISSIDTKRIRGYVTIPKYRQPQLASMSNSNAQAGVSMK